MKRALSQSSRKNDLPLSDSGLVFLGNTISSSRGFDLALLEVPECPLETGTQCDSAGSEEVSSLIYGAISVPPLQDT